MVDSPLQAELSKDAPKAVASVDYKPLHEREGIAESDPIKFTSPQIRAAILVKLVQILKLKKNAQLSTVEFLVGLLNDWAKAESTIGDGIDFYEFINSACGAMKLSEKESFVLEAPSQVLQAALALEIYNVKENLGVYDATLAFSSELLKMHADNFTEYALTLGKQSQSVNTFRNNMQAMTANSKLLGTAADRKVADYIKLPEAFSM